MLSTLAPSQWVRRIVGMIALLLISAGLLNYVINPYGLYAPNVVPQLTIQPRNDKYKLMLQHPDNGQIVILGSSRLLLMRPALVTELTGLRAFNATISRAMPLDYLVMGHFAIQTMRPQRIVAGVDLQIFHPSILWDTGSWLANSPMRAYADGEVPQQTLEHELGSLLSLQQTLDSLRSIWQNLTTPARQFPYTQNGGVAPGIRPADDSVLRGIGIFDPPDLEFWRSYTHLAPERLEQLRRFFKLCQRHGVGLTIVLMPFDERALKQLESIPNFAARLQDYRAFLRESEQYGITVYDFTDPASFGGDPQGFEDNIHPLQANMDRITRAIFTQRVTWQDGK
jgi:hypothetical protein